MPRLILRRFATDEKRLSIWRWATREIRPGSVDDLAIRNFYTILNTDGQLDGRMEELLGMVERDATPVIDWLLSPFRGKQLSQSQQVSPCNFIAFQLLRGPRKRKEIELLADYHWKLMNDGSLSPADLEELTIVPHPNEHVRMLMTGAYEVARSFLRRPVQVILLDAPLLVICDEPLLIDTNAGVQHVPDCFVDARDSRRRRRIGDRTEELLHVWTTRPAGVQTADAVALPVAPDALVVLGPEGHAIPAWQRYRGTEAAELAGEVNSALIGQATEWVAANPDHPDFASRTFPEPGPLIGVCDGGSVMSQQLQTAPVMRWQRIRRDW